MSDKLPNSKNDSYNKRQPQYDDKKRKDPSDSTRQDIKKKVDRILNN